MNPRQRRLRRQRRKARVRDAEAGRLELVELRRKTHAVMADAARHAERLAQRAVANLTEKERTVLAGRIALPLPEPALKPTGGALLAAMLKGQKA